MAEIFLFECCYKMSVYGKYVSLVWRRGLRGVQKLRACGRGLF